MSASIELMVVVCCLALALLFAVHRVRRTVRRFRALPDPDSAAPGSARTSDTATRCDTGCEGCGVQCPLAAPAKRESTKRGK